MCPTTLVMTFCPPVSNLEHLTIKIHYNYEPASQVFQVWKNTNLFCLKKVDGKIFGSKKVGIKNTENWRARN